MSDIDNKVKMIVEGLLLAAGRPLTLDNISAVFSEDERPDKKELQTVMEEISQSCGDRGFELKEVASGYRFQVKQELSEWVAKLWEERPPRYTRALLETLALVAYRQPITRGDIEEIRGVGVSSNIIRTLLDREWIRVVGHRDVPGRPAMFATTKAFLDYFNLKNLQELPPLAEIKDLAETAKDLGMEDVLADSRVLDLPEEASDENAFEIGMSDEEKMEEEAAVALSKKPLDEILAEGLAESEDDELDEDEDLDEDGISIDIELGDDDLTQAQDDEAEPSEEEVVVEQGSTNNDDLEDEDSADEDSADEEEIIAADDLDSGDFTQPIEDVEAVESEGDDEIDDDVSRL